MSIKLGEICNFQSGGTPSKNNSEFFDGTIPWVTTTALNGSKIDERNAATWITEKAIKESAAKIVPANSIMVGTRVGVGKVAVNTVEMSTSQDIISLIDINEERWDKDYLCKFLQSKSDYLNSQARGATIKGIKINVLAELAVPDISVKEQCRISEVLNTVTKLINARQQQLAKLDELVKARFVEMFGDSEYNTKHWPVVKLSDICEVGSSKRIYKNEQSSSGVPFLRISDLNERIDGKVKNPEIFISIEKYDELKLQGMVPIAGDVLVTSRGTLGRCYIVTEEDVFYFQDGMISWLSKIDARAASLYLSYLFSMRGIQKQIEMLQAGSTVAYLSITMLKKLDIMLPPPELQRRFLSFAEQIDKLKLSIKKSLEQMKTLKKALMQQYFG